MNSSAKNTHALFSLRMYCIAMKISTIRSLLLIKMTSLPLRIKVYVQNLTFIGNYHATGCVLN